MLGLTRMLILASLACTTAAQRQARHYGPVLNRSLAPDPEPTPAETAVEKALHRILDAYRVDDEAVQRSTSTDEGRCLLDLDALRRSDPDAFVPGEFGTLLGSLRIANASRVTIELEEALRVVVAGRRHVRGEHITRTLDIGTRLSPDMWSVSRFAELAALLSELSGIGEDAHAPRWLPAARVRRLLRHASERRLVIDDEIALVLHFDGATRKAAVAREIAGWLGAANEDEGYGRGAVRARVEQGERAVTVRITLGFDEAEQDGIEQPSDQPG